MAAVGGRDEFSLAIHGSRPSISTSGQEPFLLSLLLLLPARAEGKSVLTTGDKSAGPHGTMGVGFPPALVDAVWGVAARYKNFLILLGL